MSASDIFLAVLARLLLGGSAHSVPKNGTSTRASSPGPSVSTAKGLISFGDL